MPRTLGRIAATVVALALIGAGCSSSDKTPSTSSGTTTPSGSAGTPPKDLQVDRSSRFAKADTFCKPATENETETPKASGDGITADSVSITQVRVTLEDLASIGFAIPIGDPADQARRFVDIINNRCGGIHGRKLDLHIVEAPPLAGEGQDPAALAQAACIKATEDNKSVFVYSGTGWGGQGGASCVTSAHDAIYITTYTISPDDLANSDNRLYSTALSPADGLKYAAKVLFRDGALQGKKIGIVMADSPGDPEIVQSGLIDTLKELGIKPTRVDAIGCNGGNNCTQGVIESVRGMIAAGVNVMFPLLNVISLPGYLSEMATQGVKPGQIQFYNTDYNAQSGDLVSSKVVKFGGAKAGALYNNTEIISSGQTGSFRLATSSPLSSARCATASTSTPVDRSTRPPIPRPTRPTARRREPARSSGSSPARSTTRGRTRRVPISHQRSSTSARSTAARSSRASSPASTPRPTRCTSCAGTIPARRRTSRTTGSASSPKATRSPSRADAPQ